MTRPLPQATVFAEALRALGAEVLLFPMICIEDPPDSDPLHAAAREADRFDWIVFTSANAVIRFWAAREKEGARAGSLEGVDICAVGPATAAAVERQGASVSLLPRDFVGEGLVSALSAKADLRGLRILFARAEGARNVIPESLRSLGAEVVEVVAYRTVPDPSAADELCRALENRAIDVVTFTSSSAVQAFVETAGTDIGPAIVATIGPITSSTARAAGLRVEIEAEPFTTEGLTAKIVEHYARSSG